MVRSSNIMGHLDKTEPQVPLGREILDPESLNGHATVLNNPTNFIDPSGLGARRFEDTTGGAHHSGPLHVGGPKKAGGT